MGILTKAQVFFTFMGVEGGTPFPRRPHCTETKLVPVLVAGSVDMLITMGDPHHIVDKSPLQLPLTPPIAVDK